MNEILVVFAESGDKIVEALVETGWMVLAAIVAAVLLGLPLGTLIFLTRRGGLVENRGVWIAAELYVTIVRSFPFLLFVVFMIPVTRMVFGTTFGTTAASFPLAFVAIAIYARLVEQILLELPSGILTAARSMGANLWQTVTKFLYVEARSGLVYALTSATISFVSYSTVLGVVGGGGIGDFALRYGYQEYQFTLMYTAIVLTIAAVLVLQAAGHLISRALDKR
ncbi:D-methionine transport system permease protein [Brevibacterium jeotgali]|uniref:D-methionine transport system permease protein n=1 Tax=Brevibacterium jeotgali TaxID=1262550 RepID=A0A2H1L5D0_9MICO|nr:methionine ABC transporter permease [Brevibacterium jeotgali]SMY12114.1 D-methionine transport system permease protein [Brevibacterium jeotgali]